MAADLLRDQVAPRDFHLFVLGVAADADDLHAVEKRGRQARGVRGGDEHDIAQIVIHLEIVVVERHVLFGIEHFEQGRRWVAAEIGAHLVHFVEQEERVGRLRFLHALYDLAGKRADIGAAVAADLRLVAHAAQADAHEIAPGRARDGLAERRLADPRRADETQYGAAHLAGARLYREILDDALLHALEPVVVLVEHALRQGEVLLDAGALLPRDPEQPVEIVAHHRGFGGHGAHGAQLLELADGAFARLLAELGRGELALDLRQFVFLVLAFPQFLLYRLHLLIEIILALRLFHLALDARADFFLDLQDADLGLDHGVNALEALDDRFDLEQFLLLRYLDGEMRRHRIDEARRVLYLADRHQHLGRHLLVELDVVLEVGRDRAGQRLDLPGLRVGLPQGRGERLEIAVGAGEPLDARARAALDQHLDRAVGQFQQLEHRAHGAHLVDAAGLGVVLARVALRDKQYLLVVLHHLLERADRFLAAHEQRHDHVRKHDDIAQRQDREQGHGCGCVHGAGPFVGCPRFGRRARRSREPCHMAPAAALVKPRRIGSPSAPGPSCARRRFSAGWRGPRPPRRRPRPRSRRRRSAVRTWCRAARPP